MLKWLRGLTSERVAAFEPRRVRTRVTDMPIVHEVPQSVLTALRSLDDDLDVYFVRGGDAWLLQYQPGKARIQEGRKMLLQDRAEDLEDYVGFNVSAHLMARGFALLGVEPFHRGMSAGCMVTRAQKVLYQTRDQMHEEYLRIRAIADSSAAAERGRRAMIDRIESNARSDWKYAYAGKRHFSSTR